MKQQDFPSFVLDYLKKGDYTDEELCSMYIKKYYLGFLGYISMDTIPVLGKRYESCRKQLSEMRKKGIVYEVSRIRRKTNLSQIITFSLTKKGKYKTELNSK